MKLSIVTTLYKSSAFIEEFCLRATAEADKITDDYELVLVNDGSTDDSLDVALRLHGSDPRIKVIDLSRNFGHHKAMMTGLCHARGEFVFLIDCDLEEPPELLGEFMHRRDECGADVVYGVRSRRRGGWFDRASAWLYYRLFNLMSQHPLPPNVMTIRLMTRRYVDSLIAHQERETIMAGLWVITGFEQVPLEVEKSSRGLSSYDMRRKISALVNSVTSFSDRPLVFVFYLGCLISFSSAAAALYMIWRKLFDGINLVGWPSLIVSIWLLGGITIFSIGLIGIYLSKVFIETKKRPYTIIRRLYAREHSGDIEGGDRE